MDEIDLTKLPSKPGDLSVGLLLEFSTVNALAEAVSLSSSQLIISLKKNSVKEVGSTGQLRRPQTPGL